MFIPSNYFNCWLCVWSIDEEISLAIDINTLILKRFILISYSFMQVYAIFLEFPNTIRACMHNFLS